mmetsp:Transcript_3305/g.11628  ORF Transcript_3305/g.11628 Transcript_3305/m.11628 type:complete len:223 (+) Transcript_3305:388-1056(+)
MGSLAGPGHHRVHGGGLLWSPELLDHGADGERLPPSRHGLLQRHPAHVVPGCDQVAPLEWGGTGGKEEEGAFAHVRALRHGHDRGQGQVLGGQVPPLRPPRPGDRASVVGGHGKVPRTGGLQPLVPVQGGPGGPHPPGRQQQHKVPDDQRRGRALLQGVGQEGGQVGDHRLQAGEPGRGRKALPPAVRSHPVMAHRQRQRCYYTKPKEQDSLPRVYTTDYSF